MGPARGHWWREPKGERERGRGSRRRDGSTGKEGSKEGKCSVKRHALRRSRREGGKGKGKKGKKRKKGKGKD